MESRDYAVCQYAGVSTFCATIFDDLYLLSCSVTRPEPWAPQGAQHLILATLGLPVLKHVKEGIANIHVNAGLRRRVGGLRALREFEVDGEECICLSLPFSTKPEHVMKHERVVAIPEVLDPRGVVASYAQRKGHVITNRNLLDVFLAEPMDE